jgi:aldose 1-epimerase
VLTPTGERIELANGPARAEVGTIAATLCSLRIGGVAITEPIGVDESSAFCNGTVLVPWPNRVRDARWSHEGRVLQLDVTEPARGNALHGLLQFTEHEVRERTDASVTLGAAVAPQQGWPFLLDSWVRFELLPDGIDVTHGVVNNGEASAPYATGSHPFLRIGDVPVGELSFSVPAASYFAVDDRLNPTGELAVTDTTFDLRKPRLVSDLKLDTAFGGLNTTDRVSAVLAARDGSTVTVLQDDDWEYLQVFTTDIYPGPDGPSMAIAVEPMTAPPDALNSGLGLRWLEPGELWEGSWGLRYSGGATR